MKVCEVSDQQPGAVISLRSRKSLSDAAIATLCAYSLHIPKLTCSIKATHSKHGAWVGGWGVNGGQTAYFVPWDPRQVDPSMFLPFTAV